MDQQLVAVAKQAGNALKAKGLKLSTAESCTGGWVSMALCAAGDSGDFLPVDLSPTPIAPKCVCCG